MPEETRIENPGRSEEVGLLLREVYEAARARDPEHVRVETAAGTGKSAIVLAIVLGIGTGIAGEALYDLLRATYNRLRNRISGDEYVVVNGDRIKLSTLAKLTSKKE